MFGVVADTGPAELLFVPASESGELQVFGAAIPFTMRRHTKRRTGCKVYTKRQTTKEHTSRRPTSKLSKQPWNKPNAISPCFCTMGIWSQTLIKTKLSDPPKS